MSHKRTEHEARVRYLGSKTHSGEHELFELVIVPSELYTDIVEPWRKPGLSKSQLTSNQNEDF